MAGLERAEFCVSFLRISSVQMWRMDVLGTVLSRARAHTQQWLCETPAPGEFLSFIFPERVEAAQLSLLAHLR